MRKFELQLAILKTAESRLASILADIRRSLQASLLDNEIAQTRVLAQSGHIRAAGVVAGVVLEGHLRQLLQDHGVTLRKKHMLSNLNDALKDAGVYDVPRWRQIQYLADLRNLCAHKSTREPIPAEVDGLISGVDEVIHTVF